MKQYFILSLSIAIAGLICSCSKSSDSNVPPTPTTDSFSVTVNNGYGGGKYKVGDTVHVFSSNYTNNQAFSSWTGDTSVLNGPGEWHTWFIMPNKNITVTGNIQNITPFTLQYEQIMSKNIRKPVLYYFPVGYKGIVYLLHGTGGSALTLAANYEWQVLINDLVIDKYAVIITECEESTLGTDTNGDGKIRWSLLPTDSINNVDFANIRIITDTLYNRGVASRSKPRYSLGMSDGGFFSAALANIYSYTSSIQYCSQGPTALMQSTTVPTQFCMQANDDNESVGEAGDAAALSFSNALNNRGICSKYYVNQRCPLYTARFSRNGKISVSLSESIFTELKSKGYLDNRNYFIGTSNSALVNAYTTNPSSFPVMSTLSGQQFQIVTSEISKSIATHNMYSDYDKATLKYLDSPCR